MYNSARKDQGPLATNATSGRRDPKHRQGRSLLEEGHGEVSSGRRDSYRCQGRARLPPKKKGKSSAWGGPWIRHLRPPWPLSPPGRARLEEGHGVATSGRRDPNRRRSPSSPVVSRVSGGLTRRAGMGRGQGGARPGRGCSGKEYGNGGHHCARRRQVAAVGRKRTGTLCFPLEANRYARVRFHAFPRGRALNWSGLFCTGGAGAQNLTPGNNSKCNPNGGNWSEFQIIWFHTQFFTSKHSVS